MRLVLDTNVLIAAFAARGVCHELLEHCQREHELVSSEVLLEEFLAKLIEKLKVPPSRARIALDLVRSHTDLVRPEPLTTPACRDPDDDWVLATALSGQCACIVSGDKDLLDLGHYQKIRIVSPRDFWAFEGTRA